MPQRHSLLRPSVIRSVLVPASWFGIVAGLIEGVFLLLFQRIDWAAWGFMVHVSPRIIWISAFVDVIFAVLLAVPLILIGYFAESGILIRVSIFLFATLATYDWLTATARLKNFSCWLLAIGVGTAFSRWVARHNAAAMRLWARSLPWVAALSLLIFGAMEGGRLLKERSSVASLPQPAPDAPNVLIIVVDTLRADHVSSYGYARPTTTNIDRIAREGALFENALATSSWSLPSHVSLLTGRYSFEHGVDNVKPQPWFGWASSRLGPYLTLGEALERRGYRTGAFSANRIYFSSDLGFGQSFAHFEDYFHSIPDMFARTVLGRVFVRRYMYRSENSKVKRFLRRLGLTSFMDHDDEGAAGYGGPYALRKRAATVNQETLQWIERDRQRPFFAFLNYFDVHTTYGGPPAYPKPGWEQNSLVDQYDDSVKYVDDSLGSLMAELELRGLTRNTLLVVTSDHGESLSQHGLATHGRALYRELIQVPLVLWYPEHIPAGARLNTMVTNASVPATVLDLLSDAQQSQFPAQSLVPLWKNSMAGNDWPPSLAELAQNRYGAKVDQDAGRKVLTASDGPMKSLVAAQWHLILHKNLGDQLYDWRSDPTETRNLIRTDQGREVALTLISRLTDVLAQRGSQAAHPESSATLTENQVEQKNDRAGKPVDDYYRLVANAGERIAIEVRARKLNPASPLDPVLAIEDENGKLFETCRNPGDDHIPPPGVADPTPDAFDDVCVNDDLSPGVDMDSNLEIVAPGRIGSKVNLFIRVSDWNGAVGPNMRYQISAFVTPR